MMAFQDVLDLEITANRLRRHVLDMIWKAGSGHLGGSLSCGEIIAALYFRILRIDPQKPLWNGRDRFILSKGHGVPMLYAALAERGFFPTDELDTLRKLNSRLQGHPDMTRLPGIDMSTGSLGQGLSTGIGMAVGAKLRKLDYRVYVLLGDGELQEGQIWEAAMSAPKFDIDNLVAICDLNGVQLDGHVEDIMPIAPIEDKWKAFGWNTISIDGHSMEKVLWAFDKAHKAKHPTVILAHTVKGKGVSFMENDHLWHGQPMDSRQYEIAVQEVMMAIKDLKLKKAETGGEAHGI